MNIGETSQNRLRQLLSDSHRLWPNPWGAPEVPPASILQRYATGLLASHDPLSRQIQESPNCARALRLLEIGKEDDPLTGLVRSPWSGEHPGLPFDSLPARRRGFTAALRMDLQGRPEDAPDIIGQVWTTSGAVELADSEIISERQTWMPHPVLVIDEVRHTDNDYFCRAVACSPVSLWPEDWLGPDEILVALRDGSPWIAHLWLEYPVSTSQLQGLVGSLNEESAENLQVAVGARKQGLPLTSEENAGPPLQSEDDEILLERERLHKIAAWLCGTADARRVAWEFLSETGRRMGFNITRRPTEFGIGVATRYHYHPSIPITPTVRARVAEGMALTAKTPGELSSQALLIHGRPERLVESAGLPPGQASTRSAKILLEPSETTAFSGPAFAQWDVSELVPASYSAYQMIVLSPTLDAILANGYVRDGIASALGCDWEECRKTIDRWEDWVLLIFDPTR